VSFWFRDIFSRKSRIFVPVPQHSPDAPNPGRIINSRLRCRKTSATITYRHGGGVGHVGDRRFQISQNEQAAANSGTLSGYF